MCTNIAFLYKQLFIFSISFFLLSNVNADDSDKCIDHTKSNQINCSETHEKDRDRILPGEEVSTQGGKKLKVWTTEGRVEVRSPPEPFREPRHELDPQYIELQVDNSR